MGLPALLSTLSELEQEVVEAAASPSEKGTQAPVEVLAEQAKVIERLLDRIRPTLAEMFSTVAETVKALGAGGQTYVDQAIGYIDQAIEQLAVRESTLAGRLVPLIEAARKLRTQTFGARHLSREEKTRHVLVLERQSRALGAILRLFRDERWRMMTLRAEIESAGDAPVFSDPRQLVEYLQANRK